MKRLLVFSALIAMVFLGAAEVELGDSVSVFQYERDSNVNFSQPQNFSTLAVRSLKTGFGSSNFTVEPTSSAGAELDFYDVLAGRQEYVTNFTAKTDSTQDVSFNITDLPSDDFYEAFFSSTGNRIFIGYADSPDNSFNFSASILQEDISVFNYGEKGVKLENLSFNSSEPIEGNQLKIKSNVSNEGVVDPENPELNVSVETYNGTQWVFKENFSTTDTVPENGSVLANTSWEIKPGPWRFNSTLDPEDEIKETNELNNDGSELLDVDSYQIFYGGSDNNLSLGAGDKEIFRWDPEQDQGNLYFYDIDSDFIYSDLESVDGSDLIEVDNSLNLRGHNDSTQELWDPDSDGNADRTETFNVGGRSLSVPVANSSENSPFDTGILYDSGDGSPYDGSQDLVFVTKIEPDTTGSHGTYDYEVRIPFSLEELKPGAEKVQIDSQLN